MSDMSRAQVVLRTTRFSDDLAVLTDEWGFRVEMIFPADSPTSATVAGHGLRIRLEAHDRDEPIEVEVVSDDVPAGTTLPGGSRVVAVDAPGAYRLPDSRPSIVVTGADGDSGVGRAGMRYRDLLPDRWGGRFISSHITIPDGGPVPDYVHFHRIRFQMIFVKAGWVRVVYEDQGEPFVMHAGDCVLQPPEIRHRVLESSPGLEVIEIGCPAEHHTFADWSTDLPTATVDRDRDFAGQRFVRHVAAEASYRPWRVEGWEYRDTGIGSATAGLAAARVARPTSGTSGSTAPAIAHEAEFTQLVVLAGSVEVEVGGRPYGPLRPGAAVTIPTATPYRLTDATADCELLDVTLPADVRATALDTGLRPA